MTRHEVGVATGRVRHRHCGAPARLAARRAWLWRSLSRERVEDLGARDLPDHLEDRAAGAFQQHPAWSPRRRGIGYELLGDGDLAAVLRERDVVSC